MRISTVSSRGILLCLVYPLISCSARASERPQAVDTIIPDSLIVDARSILDAVRMDRDKSSSGARNQCIDDAVSAADASSAAAATKPGRLGALVGKLKERVEMAGNSETRSKVIGCSEERRSSFVPQNGIHHYAALLQSNSQYLAILANSASGNAPGQAFQVLRTAASSTCVQSMQLPARPWKIYQGILTPLTAALDGTEQAVSVVDQDCYHKSFPNAPIPPQVRILSVHEYFDRIVQSRAARVRAAGYVQYADAYTEDYLQLKGGRR